MVGGHVRLEMKLVRYGPFNRGNDDCGCIERQQTPNSIVRRKRILRK